MWRHRDAPNGHLQEAVAFATLSAQFSAHQIKCTEDKADIKRDQEEIKHALANQNVEQSRMHHENQTELGKIRRYVWIAVGAFGMLQFLAGNGWGLAILKALHQ